MGGITHCISQLTTPAEDGWKKALKIESELDFSMVVAFTRIAYILALGGILVVSIFNTIIYW